MVFCHTRDHSRWGWPGARTWIGSWFPRSKPPGNYLGGILLPARENDLERPGITLCQWFPARDRYDGCIAPYSDRRPIFSGGGPMYSPGRSDFHDRTVGNRVVENHLHPFTPASYTH